VLPASLDEGPNGADGVDTRTDQEGDGVERSASRDDPSQDDPRSVETARGTSTAAQVWGVGLGGRVSGWTGPGTPLGLGAFVEFAPRELGWSSRLSLVHTRSSTSSAQRGAAFRVYALRAEGCHPIRWSETHWVFAPCLAVSVGLMHALGIAGPELAEAREVFAPWVDAALIGRVRTPPLGGLRLEGQLEVGSALVDHHFRFDQPRATVHWVRPGLAAGAYIGVVVPL
jgi:hypothetical protein